MIRAKALQYESCEHKLRSHGRKVKFATRYDDLDERSAHKGGRTGVSDVAYINLGRGIVAGTDLADEAKSTRIWTIEALDWGTSDLPDDRWAWSSTRLTGDRKCEQASVHGCIPYSDNAGGGCRPRRGVGNHHTGGGYCEQ